MTPTRIQLVRTLTLPDNVQKQTTLKAFERYVAFHEAYPYPMPPSYTLTAYDGPTANLRDLMDFFSPQGNLVDWENRWYRSVRSLRRFPRRTLNFLKGPDVIWAIDLLDRP